MIPITPRPHPTLGSPLSQDATDNHALGLEEALRLFPRVVEDPADLRRQALRFALSALLQQPSGGARVRVAADCCSHAMTEGQRVRVTQSVGRIEFGGNALARAMRPARTRMSGEALTQFVCKLATMPPQDYESLAATVLGLYGGGAGWLQQMDAVLDFMVDLAPNDRQLLTKLVGRLNVPSENTARVLRALVDQGVLGDPPMLALVSSQRWNRPEVVAGAFVAARAAGQLEVWQKHDLFGQLEGCRNPPAVTQILTRMAPAALEVFCERVQALRHLCYDVWFETGVLACDRLSAAQVQQILSVVCPREERLLGFILREQLAPAEVQPFVHALRSLYDPHAAQADVCLRALLQAVRADPAAMPQRTQLTHTLRLSACSSTARGFATLCTLPSAHLAEFTALVRARRLSSVEGPMLLNQELQELAAALCHPRTRWRDAWRRVITSVLRLQRAPTGEAKSQ